ncbi:MAG: hypothetical protein HFG97_01785 [Dorea sp.]|nr:hypothetical protein [Dorea sp.]
MSRKRDHKIIITDEAIEKIPFIEYRGIPEEEYEIIHRLAKQVLQISKTENESNEVAITYSFDSDKVVAREEVVAVQFGSEHSVNPMADPLSYHLIMSSRECAVISLHNHPSLSLISATDIRFFLEYRSICLLVIITNLGGISYLVKSKKYNYAKAVALLNETIRLHNEAVDLKGYQKAARFFINNCYRAGIIYEDR